MGHLRVSAVSFMRQLQVLQGLLTLVLLACHSGPVLGDEINGVCIANYYNEVSDIILGRNNTRGLTKQQKEDLELYLTSTFVPCAFGADRVAARAISVVAPDTQFIPKLRNITAFWEKATGVSVRLDKVPVMDTVQEARRDVQQNVSILAHAGFMLLASTIGSVAEIGGAVDLTSMVLRDEMLQWRNILSFFRQRSSLFGGRIKCIPLDGDMLYLYYRSDMLRNMGRAIPSTWSELLDVATAVNGTDMDGDGRTDYGICMNVNPCNLMFYPFLFAGPYLQYNGTNQGAFLDPATGQPLTNNSAFIEAMTLLRALMGLSPVDAEEVGECRSYNAMFNKGRCLFTIGWGDHFKISSKAPGVHPSVTQHIGVTLTPGSTHVYERTSGQLLQCNETLCPHAQTVMKQDGATHLVNFAPYSAAGGWCFMVDKIATEQAQTDAYHLGSYLASPKVSTQLVLDPFSGFDPFREEHLNVSSWVDAGYQKDTTFLYLDAVQRSFGNGNVLMQLRLPSSGNLLRNMAQWTAQLVFGDKEESVEAAAQGLTAKILEAVGAGTGNSTYVLDFYRKGLGWEPAMFGGAMRAPGPPAPAWKDSLLSVAVLLSVGLIIGAAAAGTLIWCYLKRRGNKHVTLFGHIKPPSASPQSTLVVTDIQGSTSLWELLPGSVMDRALLLHHQTMRKVMVEQGGYESATEGDSFIVAFHAPQDAVLFCMAVQQQLLEVEWPQELLDCPSCKPVYALPRGITATALIKGSKDPESGGKQRRNSLFRSSPYVEMLLAASTIQPPQIAGPESSTYAGLLRSAWAVTEGDDMPGVQENMKDKLVYRGLRVRMGIHSGIDTSSVVSNSGANRMQYAGEALETAKKVSDVVPGGLVVMSGAAYRQLAVEPLTSTLFLMHCGTHSLDAEDEPHSLYLVVPRSLVGRLAQLDGLKSRKQVDSGALEAPIGVVTIVFVYVVGAQALSHWDQDVATKSFNMLQHLANKLLREYDGYCVEVADNLLLCSFHSPSNALEWGLQLHQQGLLLDWPERLLQNELAEVMTLVSAPDMSSAITQELVLRGLRLKIGMDMGSVLSAPHSVTGRMAYRGRVMNRAARIASMASAGEVLCSHGVWTALSPDLETRVDGVTLGEVSLKGISEPQNVMQCRLKHGRACMQSAVRINLLTAASAENELSWTPLDVERTPDQRSQRRPSRG